MKRKKDARSIVRVIQQVVSGIPINHVSIGNKMSNQTVSKLMDRYWFYRRFKFEDITETITIKSKSHEHRSPYVSYRQIARMRRLRKAIRRI